MNDMLKNWFKKNGLPLLALTLTGVTTLVNNKNNEKALEETVAKKVNEVLSNKTKES